MFNQCNVQLNNLNIITNNINNEYSQIVQPKVCNFKNINEINYNFSQDVQQKPIELNQCQTIENPGQYIGDSPEISKSQRPLRQPQGDAKSQELFESQNTFQFNKLSNNFNNSNNQNQGYQFLQQNQISLQQQSYNNQINNDINKNGVENTEMLKTDEEFENQDDSNCTDEVSGNRQKVRESILPDKCNSMNNDTKENNNTVNYNFYSNNSQFTKEDNQYTQQQNYQSQNYVNLQQKECFKKNKENNHFKINLNEIQQEYQKEQQQQNNQINDQQNLQSTGDLVQFQYVNNQINTQQQQLFTTDQSQQIINANDLKLPDYEFSNQLYQKQQLQNMNNNNNIIIQENEEIDNMNSDSTRNIYDIKQTYNLANELQNQQYYEQEQQQELGQISQKSRQFSTVDQIDNQKQFSEQKFQELQFYQQQQQMQQQDQSQNLGQLSNDTNNSQQQRVKKVKSKNNSICSNLDAFSYSQQLEIYKRQSLNNSVNINKQISQKSQQEASKRLSEQYIVQTNKIQVKKEQIVNQEMEQCSFKPKINQNNSTQASFCERQVKHQRNVSQKTEMLKEIQKEKIEEQVKNKPKICKKSQEIIEKKRRKSGNLSVHNRLYFEKVIQDENLKNKSMLIQQNSEEQLFKPQIHKRSKSIVRNQKVEDILYQDAKRRKSKENNNQSLDNIGSKKNLVKSNSGLLNESSNMSFISKQSDMYIKNKFLKEFDAVIGQLESDSNEILIKQNKEGENQVWYDMATTLEILIHMGLVKYNGVSDPDNVILENEKRLVFLMWSLLGGDNNDGFVLQDNIFEFLLSVLKLNFSNSKHRKNKSNVLIGMDSSYLSKASLSSKRQFSSNYRQISLKNNINNNKSQSQRHNRSLSQTSKQQNSILNEQLSSHKQLNKIVSLTGLNSSNNTNNDNLQEMMKNMELGEFDQDTNIWILSESDKICLSKAFQLFYRNRLSYEELKQRKSSTNKQIKSQEPSFQPKICQASQQLANQYREKILVNAVSMISNQEVEDVKIPQNGQITIQQLLVLKQKQNQKKTECLKQLLIDQEMQECSFKPNITPINGRQESDYQGKKKFFEKQENVKNKAKTEKQQQDIEWEKNADECTFQPNISQQSKKLIKNKLSGQFQINNTAINNYTENFNDNSNSNGRINNENIDTSNCNQGQNLIQNQINQKFDSNIMNNKDQQYQNENYNISVYRVESNIDKIRNARQEDKKQQLINKGFNENQAKAVIQNKEIQKNLKKWGKPSITNNYESNQENLKHHKRVSSFSGRNGQLKQQKSQFSSKIQNNKSQEKHNRTYSTLSFNNIMRDIHKNNSQSQNKSKLSNITSKLNSKSFSKQNTSKSINNSNFIKEEKNDQQQKIQINNEQQIQNKNIDQQQQQHQQQNQYISYLQSPNQNHNNQLNQFNSPISNYNLISPNNNQMFQSQLQYQNSQQISQQQLNFDYNSLQNTQNFSVNNYSIQNTQNKIQNGNQLQLPQSTNRFYNTNSENLKLNNSNIQNQQNIQEFVQYDKQNNDKENSQNLVQQQNIQQNNVLQEINYSNLQNNQQQFIQDQNSQYLHQKINTSNNNNDSNNPQQIKLVTDSNEDIVHSDKDLSKIMETNEDNLNNSQNLPLLFVDVNIGNGKQERIIVHEGDNSEDLSQKFSKKHSLDEKTRLKFRDLLDSQIANLLSRIEEEEQEEQSTFIQNGKNTDISYLSHNNNNQSNCNSTTNILQNIMSGNNTTVNNNSNNIINSTTNNNNININTNQMKY